VTAQIITAVAYDDGVEADSGALVPWWSYTKTVLAAAAFVLVSQNRVALDEPLTGGRFTLRQLL
jgi:CubicO group peptidase (beta-lactamase class C family)